MTRSHTHLSVLGLLVALGALLVAVTLGGCPQAAVDDATAPADPPRSAMEPQPFVPAEPEPPEEPQPAGTETSATADQPQEGDQQMTTIKIATNRGDITAELFDQDAPITAGSFLLLIDDGFYNGLTFHRVEPGFVIQGGDPAGNGSGGPGFSIPLETSADLKHCRGALSMARTMAPDSAGSQFFVCLSDNSSVKNLDARPGSPGYAAFGQVIDGMDAVDAITVGDTIKTITIVSESPDADAARAAAKAARIPD